MTIITQPLASITNSIWNVATRPSLHSSAIQGVCAGIALCRYGTGQLRQCKQEQGVWQKVRTAGLGILAVGAGAGLICWGGTPLLSQLMGGNIGGESDFEPPLSEGPHVTELEAGPELCTFQPEKKLPRVLQLRAFYDHNGGLASGHHLLHQFESDGLLDIRYKVVDDVNQICQEIQSAVKVGNLHRIIIDSHGRWSGLRIGATSRIHTFQSLPEGCFEGLPPNVQIFLLGCHAGSRHPFLNIAEWMAWLSGRTVYASKDVVFSSDISFNVDAFDDNLSVRFGKSSDTTQVYHPPTTLPGQAYFFSKVGLAALHGLFNFWQIARLGATALEVAGWTLEKGIEILGPRLGKGAQKLGIYHDGGAKMAKGTVKFAATALSQSGKLVHRTMDTLAAPCKRAGKKVVSFAVSKTSSALSFLKSQAGQLISGLRAVPQKCHSA